MKAQQNSVAFMPSPLICLKKCSCPSLSSSPTVFPPPASTHTGAIFIRYNETLVRLYIDNTSIGLKSKFRTKSIFICLKEIQNSDCKSEKSSPENEEVAFNIANKLLNVEKLSEVYSVDNYKILINKISFKGFFEYYLQLYISKLF